MAINQEKENNNAKPQLEEDEYITLEFDDGAEVECIILGVFPVGKKEYIALLPQDGTDDAYLYEYKEVGEEEFEILDIEDDKVFEKVAKEFDRITMEAVIDMEE